MVEGLTAALPRRRGTAVDLAKVLLQGADDSAIGELTKRPARDGEAISYEELCKARQQLRALPELAPLWNK